MGKDFYKILGVDRGCNDGDIKKAYKKLVRMCWQCVLRLNEFHAGFEMAPRQKS
jgi:hypothetical protein